ncbi:MAG TPA: LacI family DNA-binding transcriptional regulator [Chthoniobacteraceae bacterium]|nr:LacI family DNA-binding transcriptional regulator [Chthoniobacteraceae bacterium]
MNQTTTQQKRPKAEKRVTIYEIAKRAGCSAMTVSRALMPRKKSNDRISPETLEQIRALASEMGYKPNLAARGLILRKTMNVGFHINQQFSYYNPLHFPILRRLQHELEKAGYHLGFYYFKAGDLKELQKFVQPPRLVDALIVLGRNLSPEEAATIVASGVPRLALFEALEDFHSLVIDDFHGGRLAARFLHERGFRKVTLLAYWVREERWNGRIFGFMEEAKKLGMEVSEMKDFYDPHYDLPYAWRSGKVAADLLKKLRARGEAGRCLFINSDSFARAVADYLESHGVKPGGEISVLGYDDAEELEFPPTLCGPPRLTTISRPRVDIGLRAASLIVNETLSDRNEAFLPSLVVRETVGHPLTPA